ncbi:MAG: hypothetical protein KF861_01790 [Planctomycetaceae bacterium]|nr:hypothetical protein [Planctomycetaceae bacterium]
MIDLLDHPSIETRYGAFRTLTTLNPNDPSVRGEDMKQQFTLHVIPSEQPPLIHITGRQKTELVLFGEDQSFKAPLAITAGKHIWITSRAGQSHVVVTRHEVGKPSRRLEIIPEVAEVVRTVVDLGATYPDVVQMLVQAERQHNLPGKIAIDALPQAGRTYYRPAADQTTGGSSTRVGHEHMNPNIFPQIDDAVLERQETEPLSIDEVKEEVESADEPAKTGDDAQPPSSAKSQPAAARRAASTEAASADVIETDSAAESAPRRSRFKSVLSTISAYDE